jgi:hypothetical protein
MPSLPSEKISNAVTAEVICDLIKRELKLADLPMGCSFRDAGFTNEQLIRIQVRINRTYSRTVKAIHYSDNCFTLTDRFNGKD